jgi:DNA replication and repair protein RecF
MHVERLYARDFRNFTTLALRPHPRVTLIEGANGQGKTNILEALYVAAGLRSFRTTRLSECVRFDADDAEVGVRFVRRGVRTDLGVQLGGRRQKLTVDGKAARAAGFLGRLLVVIFGPTDLQLPFAEPGVRRRYLDRALFNHHPGHLGDLKRFDRALRNRNALLRAHSRGEQADLTMLDAFDALVARHGGAVSASRARFAARLSAEVGRVFARVAAPGLEASLVFEGSVSDPGGDAPLLDEAEASTRDRYVTALAASLAERRDRDLRRGYTTRGPHRDDLTLAIAGRPAREHASQGQCRALVLAMKIAEIESLERLSGEAPVLLLDDVSSELDAERNAALMRYLDELGGQVLLTTTDAAYIRIHTERAVVRVAAGQVEGDLQVVEAPAADEPADEPADGGDGGRISD